MLKYADTMCSNEEDSYITGVNAGETLLKTILPNTEMVNTAIVIDDCKR